MAQGLLLYDPGTARIVLRNQRYLDMFDLSPEVVKPGMHFRDLMPIENPIGSFKGDVDAFCYNVMRHVTNKVSHNVVETDDGRSIETMVQPLKNGGWVATQEDVTERRSAERKLPVWPITTR